MMDSSMFGYIEATLAFCIVVGWGARELWLLRKDREARQKAAQVAPVDQSDLANPADQHNAASSGNEHHTH